MKIKNQLKNAMEVAKMKRTIKVLLKLGLALLVMLMAVASASADTAATNNYNWDTYNVVTFKVAVNDYTDHKDYSQSKNIPHAFVNKYRVKLEDNAFKVDLVEIKETGDIDNPYAVFNINPGEMVYFEGFKTRSDAEKGSENKRSMSWTAPPHKNFRTASNELCQTNYLEIDQMLQDNEDYACASSLSIPYINLAAQPAELPDLTFTQIGYVSENYRSVAFKATVLNKGTKNFSNFQIGFYANGKENILTYAPILKAGETVTIASWGLSYFELEDGQAAMVQFKLDPNNQVAEVDENNNYADMAPQAGVGENEAKYYIWTRSKDQSASGKVVAYGLNPGLNQWELLEKEDSKLVKTTIVSPSDSEAGAAYRADMEVSNGRIVIFIAYYYDSQIPDVIKNSELPERKLILQGSLINGKAVVCSYTSGCSQQYSSHAEEMVYYKDGKFKTLYELPSVTNNEETTTETEESEFNYTQECYIYTSGVKPIINSSKEECLDRYDYLRNNSAIISSGPMVEPRMCTQEAKRCSDGSYVGRVGQNCEFAKCPSEQIATCDNGCIYNNKCLPFGTRIKDDNSGLYCDLGSKMLPQVAADKICFNDYECESNSCLSGKCVDLNQKLEEQQNLLEKVLAWLGKLFRSK